MATHPGKFAIVIAFIVGTSAELIKIRPVLKRLTDRHIPYELWATYQHIDGLDRTLQSFGLPEPAFVFAHGANSRPIERPSQMIPWLITCTRSLVKSRKKLRNRLGAKPLIIVHGDTVTTVFGAIAARYLRVPSAHIEAGLRSGSILRPFPEEIDRRIVSKLVTVHYAPNIEATLNLGSRQAVNTVRNTAVDGVLDTLRDRESKPPLAAPYSLVLLHRFEFISQPELIAQTVELLVNKSQVPLVFVTDAYSSGPIERALQAFPSNKVSTIEKLPYSDFVIAMRDAEFIFTDSGGIQQEAGLLGTPTMLHREVTESPDGIGRNIVLSDWDMRRIEDFLSSYANLRQAIDAPEKSPSEIIVNDLLERELI